LVRMSVPRVPLFDHDWSSRTVRLIARAQTVMNDLELVLGLPATYYRSGGPDDLSARGNQL
jgi:hypothetical protein